jgi:hypothetical protein
MSLINPGNTLEFKSVDSLFAKVRKRLNSFDAAGILDEGDWYSHVRDVLDRLGVAVYEECEAVCMVSNFKTPLPENFSYLYAAYKCTPNVTEGKFRVHPQTGFVFYIDETVESYSYCGTGACARRVMNGDKVTIRSYIGDEGVTLNLESPRLLRLSGNAKGICDSKCANLFANSASEITISNGFIYTNFNDDSIFLKYYGFPLDPETGLPKIPHNSWIEKAIIDYIVFMCFEEWMFNGTVPDIKGKWEIAKMNSDESMKSALYWVKLPSFQNTLNKIRVDRKRFSIYQQMA